jgi:hypothetical protein
MGTGRRKPDEDNPPRPTSPATDSTVYRFGMAIMAIMTIMAMVKTQLRLTLYIIRG